MLRKFSDTAYFLIEELALRPLFGSKISFVLLGQLQIGFGLLAQLLQVTVAVV